MVTEITKDFTVTFIEVYKSHQALWNVKSEQYKNRKLRAIGFNELLQKCRETYPKADREFVRKKINNLRTTYRREWLKVRASQCASDSPEDVYTPSLWYYDLLSFITNDYNDEQHEIIYYGEDNELHVKDEEIEYQTGSPTFSGSNDMDFSIYNKPLKSNDLNGSLLHSKRAYSQLEQMDEYEVVGKRFAMQLKAMDEPQRLLAEKIIGDVMYWGRVGKLSENSFKYDRDPL